MQLLHSIWLMQLVTRLSHWLAQLLTHNSQVLFLTINLQTAQFPDMHWVLHSAHCQCPLIHTSLVVQPTMVLALQHSRLVSMQPQPTLQAQLLHAMQTETSLLVQLLQTWLVMHLPLIMQTMLMKQSTHRM